MSDLATIAEAVAGRAAPGEQVEAFVARSSSTRVRAYQGEVEELTVATSQGVGVRVVRDGRQGFAHAGSLDDDVVAETLEQARDNATFGEPDEWYGLATPDDVAPPALDLWFDDVEAMSTDEKIQVAIDLERRVLGSDPRISGVRVAAYGDSAAEVAVVTSTGISVAERATGCHVSVSALAVDGDETTIGGGVDAARRPADLDVDRAAGDAVERATRLLGARKPQSRSLPVVLEPRLAATFLAIVGGMLSGERLLKGRTPFANRVGEQIAVPALTVLDDPTDPRSLGATTHDGEGLACRPNVLVDDGVLQGFLHNTYTGRRTGRGSTASAVRGYGSTPGVGLQALVVAPGTGGSFDEIVAGLDDALLVQSMSGLHSGVNAVSGDFSVGADGLMVRDGAVAEPIREATIASSVQRMLSGISIVGGEIEWLPGGSGVPTVVIDGVSLSGV